MTPRAILALKACIKGYEERIKPLIENKNYKRAGKLIFITFEEIERIGLHISNQKILQKLFPSLVCLSPLDTFTSACPKEIQEENIPTIMKIIEGCISGLKEVINSEYPEKQKTVVKL